MKTIQDFKANDDIAIGVGLRHAHYADVLAPSLKAGLVKNDIDFVEVHSENFFAKGGASRSLIREVSEKYPISLHSTALGLGSQAAIAGGYLESLKELIEVINPFLISDHAAFSWGELEGKSLHAGDLLPLVFNKNNLLTMAENIDRVQQLTGQQLLVENLSAYIQLNDSELLETEFLVRLTEMTQCGLLVDLNNLVVNAHNFSHDEPITYAKNWLKKIPKQLVGEIHLAGFAPVSDDELAIDDHSQPVSDIGWDLYQFALQRFGKVPTLIEWDNDLPSWKDLLNEANKARSIADQVFSYE